MVTAGKFWSTNQGSSVMVRWGLAFLEGQGIAAFDGGALQDVVGDICQLVIEIRGIHRAGARLDFRVARLDQSHGIAAELAVRLRNPHRRDVHGGEVIAHGIVKHRRRDGDVAARVMDDKAVGVLDYRGRRLG